MKKIVFLLMLFTSYFGFAQNAAISSHTNFHVQGSGDLIMSEVRVPTNGLATYTYYEVLGWQGTGAGYAGIQDHPQGRNFIFSIWDNNVHTDNIKEVYTGHGTKTEGFGGEGTGLKSWNFEYNWEPDHWYTLAARSWSVGNHTHYGYWVKDGITGEWKHLVTMDVAATNSLFTGYNDAFIEDWIGSGENYRETNLRNTWKRINGTWKGATAGNYSINSWDADVDGRSYNYRNNWDGGLKTDATGTYYYMACGGTVTPTTISPKTFSTTLNSTKPAYTKGEIVSHNITKITNGLLVSWELSKTKLPQFSCTIELYDNPTYQGTPIAKKTAVAHERETNITVGTGKIYGKIIYIDLFDQVSETTFSFDNSVNTDCAGILNGAAYLDNCNECVGGNTTKIACEKDCNNEWGGIAYLDDCNECVGGNTNKSACYIVTDGWYKIKSDYSKKCIYMNNGLKQFTCDDSDAQLWYIKEEETGVYSIKNKATGEYLSTPSTGNGAALAFSATLGNTEKFTMKTISQGVVQFFLYNKSSQSLDLAGWSINNDASIIVYVNTDNQNQHFLLEEKKTVTSVEDIQSEKMVIYPNPSHGVFLLNKEVSWEVYNTIGISILTGKGKEIDLSTYNEGIYFLKINNKLMRIQKN